MQSTAILCLAGLRSLQWNVRLSVRWPVQDHAFEQGIDVGRHQTRVLTAPLVAVEHNYGNLAAGASTVSGEA